MEQVASSVAYVWAFSVATVMFIIAIVVANLIPFKPDDPGTAKRRVVFWVLCAVTVVASFLINYYVASGIEVSSYRSTYLTHTAVSAVASGVAYAVVGFIIAKCSPSSKVGTIF